jgi:Tol biopolymer transport system component
LPVTEGRRLGPYEIVSSLGAGGMGEVWRARDTRLGRDVAIKILPDGFAQNETFRARFEQEARTISSLNHTNICTLFDVGHEMGTHYLVMELIDGESLADRIARGPLPPDQVLRYGSQIADALDCAHRQGIVHRDLKPANVMLTKSGAKLLDFGLARAASQAAPIQGLTDFPTQARPLTREGTILGTFQYMAPEQLEGAEADARTDIFALGALLHEMATGKRAFQGSSRTSLIAAIVSSEPAPISQIVPMAPAALDHVVKKCLEKDPDDRWQSARDVASELRWISQAGSQAGVAAPVALRRRNRERLAWGLHLLTACLAIGATWTYLTTRPKPAKPLIESALVVQPGFRVALTGGITISPDGSRLAAVLNDGRGANSIWIRSLGDQVFRQLAGTASATHPFWTADSRNILFFAEDQLRILDIADNGVRVLCDMANARGGAVNADRTVVLIGTVASAISKVPVSGGLPTPLTRLRPGDLSHRWPAFLPDGNRFVFLVQKTDGLEICQSSLDEPGTIRKILDGGTMPVFVEPGYLLFSRNGTLVAQRYDPDHARAIGDPVPLSERVTTNDRFASLFGASRDGTLVLQRGTGYIASALTWVDRTGRVEGLATPAPGLYFSPRLSRDGRRLAVDISDSVTGTGDLWTYDLARNVSSRLTFDEANESAPNWSADDKRIIYYKLVRQSGWGNIFEVAAGGTGQPQPIIVAAGEMRPTDVSRDGRWIVFNWIGQGTQTRMNIGVWSAAEKKPKPWLATPFIEQAASLSPDAKWIAYESDESGRSEIYVRSFPESTEKFRISSGGGSMAAWSHDGREITYLSSDLAMMSVAIKTSPSFDSSTPVRLFDARLRIHPTRQYDVTADGKRFLLNRVVDGGPTEPIVMLQNWQEKLR